MLVECEYCKKEFNKKDSEIRRTKHHYCCKEHSNLAKQKRVILICEFCNKEFKLPPGEAFRINKERKFCSQICANKALGLLQKGSEHPNFLHGKDIDYRQIAFENYPHECFCCKWKQDERILQVHHKDSDRTNNQKENLAILCPTCHWSITLGLYELKDNKLIQLN